MPIRWFFSALFALLSAGPTFAQAPAPDPATWAVDLSLRYYVIPNTTYLAVGNHEAKLDVFVPRTARADAPVPTVIFFHGGGWGGGDKGFRMELLPYLDMGWAAVNVGYRGWLDSGGLAPVAVEESRCALRWVIRNAAKHGFDVTKLVVTGESAGSHLALTTGMLPASAGLDGRCPGPEELKVAAIINWYGVTDVLDVLEGANQKSFAVQWFGEQPNSHEVARRVSPLQYVRLGLPPILTIHGEADTVAPYNHATRLHKALDEAKVANQLVTIPGGGHGSFSRDQTVGAYAAIRAFLRQHAIVK